MIVELSKEKEIETISRPPPFNVCSPLFVWNQVGGSILAMIVLDVVFDGAFGGVRDEEVVVGEGVVVISSSLDMLTNNYLGEIMASLIFLEGLDEEALVEFMVK
ncbi:hypothetical protein Tco_1336274 [Tanacetum coccineum]